ncbi:unnamed protein product [Amoebophrya sp. A120]|nr:unnamed protein product [Amoebophrya sp. A120]|eukprot:GSA120T00026364001.1
MATFNAKVQAATRTTSSNRSNASACGSTPRKSSRQRSQTTPMRPTTRTKQQHQPPPGYSQPSWSGLFFSSSFFVAEARPRNSLKLRKRYNANTKSEGRKHTVPSQVVLAKLKTKSRQFKFKFTTNAQTAYRRHKNSFLPTQVCKILLEGHTPDRLQTPEQLADKRNRKDLKRRRGTKGANHFIQRILSFNYTYLSRNSSLRFFF